MFFTPSNELSSSRAVCMGRGLIEKQCVPGSLAGSGHCLLAAPGSSPSKIPALHCWAGLAEPIPWIALLTWSNSLCIC